MSLSKIINRIVTLLLLPCLVADPALSQLHFQTPEPRKTESSLFQEQALTAAVVVAALHSYAPEIASHIYRSSREPVLFLTAGGAGLGLAGFWELIQDHGKLSRRQVFSLLGFTGFATYLGQRTKHLREAEALQALRRRVDSLLDERYKQYRDEIDRRDLRSGLFLHDIFLRDAAAFENYESMIDQIRLPAQALEYGVTKEALKAAVQTWVRILPQARWLPAPFFALNGSDDIVFGAEIMLAGAKDSGTVGALQRPSIVAAVTALIPSIQQDFTEGQEINDRLEKAFGRSEDVAAMAPLLRDSPALREDVRRAWHLFWRLEICRRIVEVAAHDFMASTVLLETQTYLLRAFGANPSNLTLRGYLREMLAYVRLYRAGSFEDFENSVLEDMVTASAQQNRAYYARFAALARQSTPEGYDMSFPASPALLKTALEDTVTKRAFQRWTRARMLPPLVQRSSFEPRKDIRALGGFVPPLGTFAMMLPAFLTKTWDLSTSWFRIFWNHWLSLSPMAMGLESLVIGYMAIQLYNLTQPGIMSGLTRIYARFVPWPAGFKKPSKGSFLKRSLTSGYVTPALDAEHKWMADKMPFVTGGNLLEIHGKSGAQTLALARKAQWIPWLMDPKFYRGYRTPEGLPLITTRLLNRLMGKTEDLMGGSPEAYFDVIVYIEKPELPLDPALLFTQARRLLKPGGVLLVELSAQAGTAFTKGFLIETIGFDDVSLHTTNDGKVRFIGKMKVQKATVEAPLPELGAPPANVIQKAKVDRSTKREASRSTTDRIKTLKDERKRQEDEKRNAVALAAAERQRLVKEEALRALNAEVEAKRFAAQKRREDREAAEAKSALDAKAKSITLRAKTLVKHPQGISKAIALLKEGAREIPDNSIIRVMLGNMLLIEGRRDEALVQARAAVQIDASVQARTILIRALEANHLLTEAETECLSAIEQYKEDKILQQHWVRIRQMQAAALAKSAAAKAAKEALHALLLTAPPVPVEAPSDVYPAPAIGRWDVPEQLALPYAADFEARVKSITPFPGAQWGLEDLIKMESFVEDRRQEITALSKAMPPQWLKLDSAQRALMNLENIVRKQRDQFENSQRSFLRDVPNTVAEQYVKDLKLDQKFHDRYGYSVGLDTTGRLDRLGHDLLINAEYNWNDEVDVRVEFSQLALGKGNRTQFLVHLWAGMFEQPAHSGLILLIAHQAHFNGKRGVMFYQDFLADLLKANVSPEKAVGYIEAAEKVRGNDIDQDNERVLEDLKRRLGLTPVAQGDSAKNKPPNAGIGLIELCGFIALLAGTAAAVSPWVLHSGHTLQAIAALFFMAFLNVTEGSPAPEGETDPDILKFLGQIKQNPEDSLAWFNLALVYTATKRQEEAHRAFVKLMSLSSTPSMEPDFARHLIRSSARQLADRNVDTALRFCQALLNEFPPEILHKTRTQLLPNESDWPVWDLAMLSVYATAQNHFIPMKDYESAWEALSFIVRQDPAELSKITYIVKGELLGYALSQTAMTANGFLENGQVSKAQEVFREWLLRSPAGEDREMRLKVLLEVARLDITEDKAPEALETLQSAAQLVEAGQPDSTGDILLPVAARANLWIMSGIVEKKLGNKKESHRHLQKALTFVQTIRTALERGAPCPAPLLHDSEWKKLKKADRGTLQVVRDERKKAGLPVNDAALEPFRWVALWFLEDKAQYHLGVLAYEQSQWQIALDHFAKIDILRRNALTDGRKEAIEQMQDSCRTHLGLPLATLSVVQASDEATAQPSSGQKIANSNPLIPIEKPRTEVSVKDAKAAKKEAAARRTEKQNEIKEQNRLLEAQKRQAAAFSVAELQRLEHEASLRAYEAEVEAKRLAAQIKREEKSKAVKELLPALVLTAPPVLSEVPSDVKPGPVIGRWEVPEQLGLPYAAEFESRVKSITPFPGAQWGLEDLIKMESFVAERRQEYIALSKSMSPHWQKLNSAQQALTNLANTVRKQREQFENSQRSFLRDVPNTNAKQFVKDLKLDQQFHARYGYSVGLDTSGRLDRLGHDLLINAEYNWNDEDDVRAEFNALALGKGNRTQFLVHLWAGMFEQPIDSGLILLVAHEAHLHGKRGVMFYQDLLDILMKAKVNPEKAVSYVAAVAKVQREDIDQDNERILEGLNSHLGRNPTTPGASRKAQSPAPLRGEGLLLTAAIYWALVDLLSFAAFGDVVIGSPSTSLKLSLGLLTVLTNLSKFWLAALTLNILAMQPRRRGRRPAWMRKMQATGRPDTWWILSFLSKGRRATVQRWLLWSFRRNTQGFLLPGIVSDASLQDPMHYDPSTRTIRAHPGIGHYRIYVQAALMIHELGHALIHWASRGRWTGAEFRLVHGAIYHLFLVPIIGGLAMGAFLGWPWGLSTLFLGFAAGLFSIALWGYFHPPVDMMKSVVSPSNPTVLPMLGFIMVGSPTANLIALIGLLSTGLFAMVRQRVFRQEVASSLPTETVKEIVNSFVTALGKNTYNGQPEPAAAADVEAAALKLGETYLSRELFQIYESRLTDAKVWARYPYKQSTDPWMLAVYSQQLLMESIANSPEGAGDFIKNFKLRSTKYPTIEAVHLRLAWRQFNGVDTNIGTLHNGNLFEKDFALEQAARSRGFQLTKRVTQKSKFLQAA